MTRSSLARFVNPWKYKREQEAARVAALRRRDGERCARCRRPLRFDLPAGHDLGARVEPLMPAAGEAGEDLANLCLTHGRCNAQAGDNTSEVRQRVRHKAEAALFGKSRAAAAMAREEEPAD